MQIKTLDDLRKAIGTVVEYNWNDELDDYRDNCSDDPGGNQRSGHIFETLVSLDNFVHGYDNTPADFLQPRPNAFPVIRISIDGEVQGEFFWDARLEQIRRTDNPHDCEDISADTYEILNGLKPGEDAIDGGGAQPIFRYERIS